MFDLKANVAACKDWPFLRYANNIKHSIAKFAWPYELNDSIESRVATRVCKV